jgi:hypothetical protein
LFSLCRLVIFLRIENKTDATNELIEKEFDAGNEVNIIINREIIQKKEHPYSECIEDLDNYKFSNSSIYNHITKVIKNTYKKHLCLKYLKNEEALNMLNCYLAWFPKLNNEIDICTSEQCSFCDAHFANYARSDICPLECTSSSYEVSYILKKYPSIARLNELRTKQEITSKFINPSNVSDEDIASSVVKLQIYYDKMSYRLLKEVPKVSELSLISNIGGTMGLFLGISLLTFIEILEISIIVISSFLNRRLS